MDDTNDGSGSSRRSDGWYHRWIRKQSKERWIVLTMDQEAVEGAMDQDAVDGLIKITTYTRTNYYYFCYFYYLN